MSENEDKMAALEAKVKKLIDSHKLLKDENGRLKEEINLLSNKVKIIPPARKRGRPLNSTKDTMIVSEIDFSDTKNLRKLVDEMIKEIDKSIKKLES